MSRETNQAANEQLMERHLVASIQEYLSFHLTKNAVFLAERLVAQFPSENNLHLLATCYHRSGQTYKAYHLLRGLNDTSCRYLFAVCCLGVGKLTEAEEVLSPSDSPVEAPYGAPGLYLLGKVYRLSNRHKKAHECFQRALSLDPLMWCAFEELCALGVEDDTLSYVQMETSVGQSDKNMTSTPQEVSALSHNGSIQAATPFSMSVSMPDKGSFETPDVIPQAMQPPPMKRVEKDSSFVPYASPRLLEDNQLLDSRKFSDEGTVRKISSKLFADPATALKSVRAIAEPAGEDRGNGIQSATPIAGQGHGHGIHKSSQGLAACVQLLQILGQGYRLLSLYKCHEAVEAFSKVPLHHYSTGWVLQCVGQAYFEMVDYVSSEKVFQQLRSVDPCRLEGLEVYSTVLWHMKKEIDLCNLAQEAISLDRHSPIAWCIMGNCFSLQKEHETSLRFFQRSLQLDPTFPYAYTLCGHEYFANEDFEKGLTCYRHALRLNPRHYNAWFGSGHIYFRQEKYGMAEYHFRRACYINRRSSVLKCYLGMALHKVNRTSEAKLALKEAVESDPKNPLARFEYALVLLSLGDLEESVTELTLLHEIVPKEASVLFQKGKVMKRLGRQEDALKCFSDALDLQPPSIDVNLIKAAIDRISIGDDADDEL